MRTRSALLAATCVLAVSVAAGGFLNESIGADKGMPPNHPQLEKFSKVSGIVMDKCMACHSRNYDLPFYAKIPGIKEIIEKDFKDGLRAMDLNLELVEAAKDKPIGEATLAKMEWVITNETMPPAKFTAVHWGSRVSSDDRAAILDWVKASRAAHYATDLAAPQRANEPLQPLPDALPVNAAKVALGENCTTTSGYPVTTPYRAQPAMIFRRRGRTTSVLRKASGDSLGTSMPLPSSTPRSTSGSSGMAGPRTFRNRRAGRRSTPSKWAARTGTTSAPSSRRTPS